MLTGDEIVILDREMQRLRAENAKMRAAISSYLDWCSDPHDWSGDPELKKIRTQMASALKD